MDPFSQAALGAVVAQTVGHRTLGYRAALYGATAGALPDVDVFFSIGGDFIDQLITHRGITHSLFFAPVAGPLLGWLIWRWQRRKDPDGSADPANRRTWMIVITLALLSHPLLDLLTPYGTQLLLPFSDARFAINAMPIIDPVYTLLLGLGLLLAWLLRSRFSATWVASATLLLSSSYLCYGWLQGIRAEQAAAIQLQQAGIGVERLAAFPTILQVHLRRVVARSADADRVGFYSTWAPCDIDWYRAERTQRTEIIEPFLSTREGRVFNWFSMGWAHYRLEPESGGFQLTVSDLRYGFDDDPLSSVFTLNALVDGSGNVANSATAGRTRPTDTDALLERLITDTYAPACRLLGSRSGTGDAIRANIVDNADNEMESP